MGKPGGVPGDLNAAGNSVFQLGNMGDQPNKPPAVLQRGQGFHGGVQGFPVQAAEALVDEQGVQPHRARMVLHHV